MPDYFFKIGSRNPIIYKLKRVFFNTRPYLKIKNTATEVFDDVFRNSIAEFQQYYRLNIQDGSLNEETYSQIGKELSDVSIDMISFNAPNFEKTTLRCRFDRSLRRLGICRSYNSAKRFYRLGI